MTDHVPALVALPLGAVLLLAWLLDVIRCSRRPVSNVHTPESLSDEIRLEVNEILGGHDD